MAHLDALSAALASPVLRPLLERAAARILGDAEQGERGRADFERLHWGAKSQGLRLEELAPEPDRLVVLGDLSRVGYLTKKGRNEVEEFVHVFGSEQVDGTHLGPRPLLVVGFYDDEEEPESLHILRARSDYRVTTHGIEG